jgi:hypothetical protein
MTRGHNQEEAWYDKPFMVALVGSILIIIGNIVTTVMPMLYQDSDFYITIDKGYVEPDPNEIPPELIALGYFNNVTYLEKTIRFLKIRPISAHVSVNNTHRWLKEYNYRVYLKAISVPKNVTIFFYPNNQEPTFTTNMSIFIGELNNSIIDYPVTIQGIGEDGRIRNCTFYLDYFSKDDCMKIGKGLLALQKYNDSLKWFKKINKSSAK